MAREGREMAAQLSFVKKVAPKSIEAIPIRPAAQLSLFDQNVAMPWFKVSNRSTTKLDRNRSCKPDGPFMAAELHGL
jgi:hypothetical protein